jgi:hypothetical protein
MINFLPNLIRYSDRTILEQHKIVKHCLDFPLYFQLPYLPEETCFQQAGSFVVEGTNQPVTIFEK